MFVKVVRRDDEGTVTTIYPCKSVVRQTPRGVGDEATFWFRNHQDGPDHEYKIERNQQVAVYAMNDQGATVDTLYDSIDYEPK